MSYYPFYMDLDGKTCLIVGGGKVAYRKAQTFLDFGASVVVIAPEILDALWGLQRHNSGLHIIDREFQEDDLDNIQIVVAATNQKDLNQRIMDLCESKRILGNNAGSRSKEGIHFGSTIRRGTITIGISTNGDSPALNAHLKATIENSLPEYYEKIAQSMESHREGVIQMIDKQEDRSQVFRQMVQLAVRNKGNLCNEDVEKIMLEQTGGQVDGEN